MLAGGHDPRVAAAAGHAGVAYAMTGLMRALPRPCRAAASAICPPTSAPPTASTARTLARGQATPELLMTLADLRRIARDHLAARHAGDRGRCRPR